MLFVKAKVGKSEIHGNGLILSEPVKKGEVICFPLKSDLMTEQEYTAEQKKDNKTVIGTGVRYFGKYFTYGGKIGPEDYINHSSEPNMLYHCGILIAKKDLNTGDELTADYRYFLANNEMSRIIDQETKNEIKGYSPKECLLKSAAELMDIISDLPDDWEAMK